APASISPALSPSSSSTAITALTFTFSAPSPTRILPMMPSSTASTSMVALSVSISAITSPEETVSPSLTCHLARVPSSIVGDRAGIVMLMGIGASLWLAIGDGVDRGDHLVDAGQGQLFEVGGVGHGNVL